MVVKAICIDCKKLKSLGVNVRRVCVMQFRVYVSRVSNVESLCLVRYMSAVHVLLPLTTLRHGW